MDAPLAPRMLGDYQRRPPPPRLPRESSALLRRAEKQSEQ